MKPTLENHTVPVIEVNSHFISTITEQLFNLSARGGLWISDQQNALNFRHRKSAPGYQSDWHMAGDPTLIIISQGILEIELRDQSTRQFSAGDQFIAADYLPAGTPFDQTKHGHRARVVGDETLVALHIKLSKCTN